MSADNLHILLVDDHDESLFVLARLLERCGHTVRTARDFAEAIAAAATDRFDLLISDVGLPDRSGLELMQEVRALYGVRGIALSGFTDQLDARASEGAGFAKHLNKPVVFTELTAAIEEVAGCCPPQRPDAQNPSAWHSAN
jgi:CheY-like chemotaxis protein